MSQEFNPYQQWLGIEQPVEQIDYYSLLGLEPYESDQNQIDEASLQRVASIRTHQLGEHQHACEQLLRHLAIAKLTLTDPVRREKYDGELAQSRLASSLAKAEESIGEDDVNEEIARIIQWSEQSRDSDQAADVNSARSNIGWLMPAGFMLLGASCAAGVMIVLQPLLTDAPTDRINQLERSSNTTVEVNHRLVDLGSPGDRHEATTKAIDRPLVPLPDPSDPQLPDNSIPAPAIHDAGPPPVATDKQWAQARQLASELIDRLHWHDYRERTSEYYVDRQGFETVRKDGLHQLCAYLCEEKQLTAVSLNTGHHTSAQYQAESDQLSLHSLPTRTVVPLGGRPDMQHVLDELDWSLGGISTGELVVLVNDDRYGELSSEQRRDLCAYLSDEFRKPQVTIHARVPVTRSEYSQTKQKFLDFRHGQLIAGSHGDPIIRYYGLPAIAPLVRKEMNAGADLFQRTDASPQRMESQTVSVAVQEQSFTMLDDNQKELLCRYLCNRYHARRVVLSTGYAYPLPKVQSTAP